MIIQRNKINILILVMVWVCILAAPGSALAQEELKIVYNPGVAPLKFEDEYHEFSGLFADLWKLWAEKTGARVTFLKADSFDDSLKFLTEGKADLHAGIFKTPEREKYLDYSSPFFELNYFIFTHPTVNPITSLDKTSGFIVGLQKGGYTEKFVRSKVPEKNIVLYDSFGDLFRASLEGEIKVFVATELSLLYFLKENYIPNIFNYYRNRPLYTQTYYTAAAKGNPDLIKTVDEGLAAITTDEKKVLEDKWVVQNYSVIPEELAAIFTLEERRFLSAKPVIKANNESARPPFSYARDGRPYGFSVDYLKLLGQKLGLPIEFVTGPSRNDFLNMVRTGQIDVLSDVVKNTEREAWLSFTPPYVTVAQALFTRKGFPQVQSVEDLYGKRLAAPKGDHIIDQLKIHPKIKIVETEDMIETIHSVSVGEADALYGAMPVVNYLINNYQITNLKVGGDPGLDDGRPVPLHLAVGKDKRVLAGILEKAMQRITRMKRPGWRPAGSVGRM